MRFERLSVPHGGKPVKALTILSNVSRSCRKFQPIVFIPSRTDERGRLAEINNRRRFHWIISLSYYQRREKRIYSRCNEKDRLTSVVCVAICNVDRNWTSMNNDLMATSCTRFCCETVRDNISVATLSIQRIIYIFRAFSSYFVIVTWFCKFHEWVIG